MNVTAALRIAYSNQEIKEKGERKGRQINVSRIWVKGKRGKFNSQKGECRKAKINVTDVPDKVSDLV